MIIESPLDFFLHNPSAARNLSSAILECRSPLLSPRVDTRSRTASTTTLVAPRQLDSQLKGLRGRLLYIYSRCDTVTVIFTLSPPFSLIFFLTCSFARYLEVYFSSSPYKPSTARKTRDEGGANVDDAPTDPNHEREHHHGMNRNGPGQDDEGRAPDQSPVTRNRWAVTAKGGIVSGSTDAFVSYASDGDSSDENSTFPYLIPHSSNSSPSLSPPLPLISFFYLHLSVFFLTPALQTPPQILKVTMFSTRPCQISLPPLTEELSHISLPLFCKLILVSLHLVPRLRYRLLSPIPSATCLNYEVIVRSFLLRSSSPILQFLFPFFHVTLFHLFFLTHTSYPPPSSSLFLPFFLPHRQIGAEESVVCRICDERMATSQLHEHSRICSKLSKIDYTEGSNYTVDTRLTQVSLSLPTPLSLSLIPI